MLDKREFAKNFDAWAARLADRGGKLDLSKFRPLIENRSRLYVELESLQATRNQANEQMKQLAKSDPKALEAKRGELKQVSAGIKEKEEALAKLEEELESMLYLVPNLPHESVPKGAGADDNPVVRSWGEKPRLLFTPKQHFELGEKLGMLDFERAGKVSGARFAFLKGALARLERALVTFMIDEHNQRGYTELLPPYLVNRASMTGTGQLPKFEEDAFKTAGEAEYFLIPTAEVPVTNYHRDEILEGSELPKKYCAFSPCFRAEAGAAGKDTRGLIRMHQFHKVELVKFARPEDSLEELEGLTRDAEHILQRLGLHYRVVLLCTGDMGFSATKTYDLEVWLPGQNAYRGDQLLLVVRRLPGAAREDPLPRRQGRQATAGAHAERLGAGGGPHAGGDSRELPAGGWLGRAARGAAALPSRSDRAEARPDVALPPRSSMRVGSTIALWAALAAGCSGGELGAELKLSYAGPNHACVLITATPKGPSGQKLEGNLRDVSDGAMRTIGLKAAPGWVNPLTVTLEAREKGCDGKPFTRVQVQVTASHSPKPATVALKGHDADRDGYASADGPFFPGELGGTDCDDNSAAVHPGAPEICNGIDDDCQGGIDDGLPNRSLYFHDFDHDGFGNPDGSVLSCDAGPDLALDAGDCDDTRGYVHPGAAETCDGLDDDCNGLVDDGLGLDAGCDGGFGCPGVTVCDSNAMVVCQPLMSPRTWYPDRDGDGHGDSASAGVQACVSPMPGDVPLGDDCDDADPFVHPGAPQLCNGLDSACTGDAGACDGGWVKQTLPTGGGTSWKAVAPIGRGQTWIAGFGSAIARTLDGGGFEDFTNKCSGNFQAAWANPNGALYLVQNDGKIDRLQPDGGCTGSFYDPGGGVAGWSITGLGYDDGGASLFYAMINPNQVVRLEDDGTLPAQVSGTWNFSGVLAPTSVGFGAGLLLAGGSCAGCGSAAALYALEDDGGTTRAQWDFVAGTPYLYAVSGTDLCGFSGGDQGLLFRVFSGSTTVLGLGGFPEQISALAAFGPEDVFFSTRPGGSTGRIWRLMGERLSDGGYLPFSMYDGGQPLNALGGTAPDDLWSVGDSNTVLHLGP